MQTDGKWINVTQTQIHWILIKKFTQHKFFSSALICVIKNNFRKNLTFYSQSELLKQIVFPTKTQFLDTIF